MKDVNKIILIGRLGADPVHRETKAGMPVIHFSVATSRRIPVRSGAEGELLREETQWHRIVAWGKQGVACAQFLKKGAPVYVEGMVRTSKYKDKDGESRYSFEVHADTVSFLGQAAGTRLTAAESDLRPSPQPG
jgi:single-strand DNA-binding protein